MKQDVRVVVVLVVRRPVDCEPVVSCHVVLTGSAEPEIWSVFVQAPKSPSAHRPTDQSATVAEAGVAAT